MHNPKTEEVFEIRGGVPDPEGTGLRGMSAGLNLNSGAIANPAFRWRDRISTGELFRSPDDGSFMYLFFCPRCAQSCKVDSHRKDIGWEPHRPDVISISKFGCTWCGLTIRIDAGVAHDEAPIGVMQGDGDRGL